MTAVKPAGPLLVSIVFVGTLGVVHGISTDRWGPSGQLQQAVAALDRVPATVGNWASEDLAYEPADMARAGINRCIFRRYQNPRTREAVSVLLVCGRGGPISVHTPEVCYAGAGFRQMTDAQPREMSDAGGGKHSFRVARFGKPGGVSKGQLEVYWAWSRDGQTWGAPENPRLSFARSPALYKLYLVREFLPSSRTATTDACQEFLRRALPEIRDRMPASDERG